MHQVCVAIAQKTNKAPLVVVFELVCRNVNFGAKFDCFKVTKKTSVELKICHIEEIITVCFVYWDGGVNMRLSDSQ